MEKNPDLGMQPSSSLFDEVELDNALGDMMSTLNAESIDALVASCIGQEEQEAAA